MAPPLPSPHCMLGTRRLSCLMKKLKKNLLKITKNVSSTERPREKEKKSENERVYK